MKRMRIEDHCCGLELAKSLKELDSHEIIEIYEYYDRPLLFASRDKKGQAFLNLLTNELGSREIWLCVPISETRLSEVTKGEITFRDAFLRSEKNQAYRVSILYWQSEMTEVSCLNASEISEAELPLDECNTKKILYGKVTIIAQDCDLLDGKVVIKKKS